MRATLPRRSMFVVSIVLVATLVFLPACSSPSPSASPPTTSSAPSSTTAPGGSHKEALGTNSPAVGDCTTNTSEAATSVGYVVLKLTAGSFQAEIQLQKGAPNTTYGVYMQQVPGSCPQNAANAGTFTTNSAGRGQASASVARVPGATTFFVQLVSAGAGPAQFTSDRISKS